jgi:hypothetical protein
MAEFDLPTWVEFDLNGPSKFGCSDSGNDFELKNDQNNIKYRLTHITFKTRFESRGRRRVMLKKERAH